MKNNEIIKKAIETMDEHGQCTKEYDVATFALYHAISPVHREQLNQLVKTGPVWDGDVVSKSHRSDLIQWGLASRAYFKGEDGYTVANYMGGNVNAHATIKPAPESTESRVCAGPAPTANFPKSLIPPKSPAP